MSALAIGVVLERFANYIWFEEPLFKGQAVNILVAFAYFAIAGVLWILLSKRRPAHGLLLLCLVLLSAAWVVHLVLYRIHGDSFNYTSLLYLPVLLLIYLKPPTTGESRTATISLAWTVAVVIVVTRILEMSGLLTIKPQPEGVIVFDTERYYLPLNDFLGIEGRWTGPFGHNGDSAMMAALIVVIAFAFWSKSSWVFLIVGGLTLILTNGRASIGAAIAGLVLIAMFSRSPRLSVISRSWRIGLGTVTLVAAALFMFARPAGLTGREKIWPAFLELWRESPWIGVGGSGIANGNEIAQAYGHAHSLYIDELARWGLVGFVSQFAALGFGLYIAARAAGRGNAGPLAVMVTYFITGITEPRNNWIVPSATGFLLILMVLAASAYLSESSRGSENQKGTGRAHFLTRTTGADSRPGGAAADSGG